MAYGKQREIGDRVYVAREDKAAYDALKAAERRIEAEFAPKFAAVEAEFIARTAGMPSRLVEMIRRCQIDEAVRRGWLQFSSPEKRASIKEIEAWYRAAMDALYTAQSSAKADAKRANAAKYAY